MLELRGPVSTMIPVVDIFAGPGGLSEGFSQACDSRGESAFDVALSIEKDQHAFNTLLLRSFFRQFRSTPVPEAYYDHLRGAIRLEDLFSRHHLQAQAASQRTWRAELGSKDVPLPVLRARIDQTIGSKRNWVLIGGPPCQAYSIAGRSRNRGKPDYTAEKDIRQMLYVEYLQILADYGPAVFVMENVKGLLSATLNNQWIFHRIVEDLRNPTRALRREGRDVKAGQPRHTYRICSLSQHGLFEDGNLADSIVECERYGIPQARHRIILLGLLNDLDVTPGTLVPGPEVSVSEVINDLPTIRSGLSRCRDSDEAWGSRFRKEVESRWANAGTRRSGGCALSALIKRALRTIAPPRCGRGGEFVPGNPSPKYAVSWFVDSRLGGFCNHSARCHIERDLYRYLYAACYAQAHGSSPRLRNFPTDLLPDHLNVALALEEGGNFSDRFRVQVAERPATTITSHIAKDGHYYIHPDPAQCRSLTVREAARIQTFPDNYFFSGPRTAQYTQVGNAVPPLLAKQIAGIVLDVLTRSGIAP
jgi:DNA (cytosine-5)-methyltransferase 1